MFPVSEGISLMKQRPFGRTNIPVSEVGLGTWQIGSEWGPISEKDSLEVLRAAYENGVTFFDTADIYGLGKSERLIARFKEDLKQEGKEPNLFIATKLGRMPDPGIPENFSFRNFQKFCQNSRERLQVDSLDLTQLHCIPKQYLENGEVFDWLRELKSQNYIRHFGASVESMEEALICMEQEDLASLQIIFNIFRQRPIKQLFTIAREKGVALIIRLPLASGLLSGKMTRDTEFDPTDHRNFNRNGEKFNVGETFAGLPFEIGVDLANELKQYVPEGMTMAQMALRWILDFDAVTTIIPGARNCQQVESNCSASDLPPLGQSLHNILSDFFENQVQQHIRGPQ
jgi:aryl-alcohol dehydrogenase-like predicted oxidoreductase